MFTDNERKGLGCRHTFNQTNIFAYIKDQISKLKQVSNKNRIGFS